MPTLASVHIGTSGWHYSHWRGPFYPDDLAAERLLAFYAARFPTLEINSSFYRLPSSRSLRTQGGPGCHVRNPWGGNLLTLGTYLTP
jgi:hypothetical protein